ncbi:MAG: AAA family ATPase [Bacteroidota bacterium]
MYIKRKIDSALLAWSKETSRKPLLLRGARQVGKSSVVRELSKHFEFFLEVNFEEHKKAHSLFNGDLSPEELCNNLSTMYNIPVIEGRTLLFFDEVQACLPAISSLRFFYEKFRGLHLIAAGSLLEFVFEDLPSFGVGRIRSMFIYPFSFDEFLPACNENLLLKAKNDASLDFPLHDAVHQKLLSYLKKFLILGGMPEVIAEYVQEHNIRECQRILDDLIISLKADFTKYRKRVPMLRISEVFESTVQQAGSKFKYAGVFSQANHKQIKEALDVLIMAGLVIPVTHTSANGIPLGAESDLKKRKMLIFDTGIFQRLAGLNIQEVLFEDGFNAVNKGKIAELFIGLELLKASSCYQHNDLYYWHREALNSNAEVDYLIMKDQKIIPVEIKSGTKGSMQSLYLFIKEKKAPFGIRFSLENFSSYGQIRSYPLYSVSNLEPEV